MGVKLGIVITIFRREVGDIAILIHGNFFCKIIIREKLSMIPVVLIAVGSCRQLVVYHKIANIIRPAARHRLSVPDVTGAGNQMGKVLGTVIFKITGFAVGTGKESMIDFYIQEPLHIPHITH